MATRRVVLKGMCEAQILGFKQVADGEKVMIYDTAAKMHVDMNGNGIIDYYSQ